MKKILVFIIILFLIQYVVYAGTYTTNYSLYKPERGEVDWENALSADFDTIDRTMLNLSEDTEGLSTDVENVRELVEGLSTDVEQIRDYTEGLSTDVENVREIAEQITGLSTDVENIREIAETNTSTIAGLSTDVENVREIAETNTATVAGLSTDVESIRDYSEGLSGDVGALRDYTEGLSGDVGVLRDYTEGLSTDVEAVRNYSETLSTDVESIYAKKSGNIYQRTHNFGEAILEIPNSVTPTVDADGEIAWNTEHNSLIVFDGLEKRAIPTSQDIDVLIFAPDSVNDEVPIFHIDAEIYPDGIEVANLQITLPSVSTYTLPIEEWSGTPPLTAPVISRDIVTLSTDVTEYFKEAIGVSIDTERLSADNYIYLSVPSTDVDWVHCKIIFWVIEK